MDIVNQFYAGREMIRMQEVADRLGIHRNTLNKYVAEGRIPFHNVPNFGHVFDWAEVQAWHEDAKKLRPIKAAPMTESQAAALRKASYEATIARAEAALQSIKDRYPELQPQKKEAA